MNLIDNKKEGLPLFFVVILTRNAKIIFLPTSAVKPPALAVGI